MHPLCCLCILLVAALPSISAANTTISVGGGNGIQFVPSSVGILVGDTVTWNWVSSNHNVVSGTGCVASSPALFATNVESSPYSFSYTFTQEGSYGFYCAPHCGDGMSGTVTVSATTPSDSTTTTTTTTTAAATTDTPTNTPTNAATSSTAVGASISTTTTIGTTSAASFSSPMSPILLVISYLFLFIYTNN